MENLGYLFVAYGIIFVVIFLYVSLLWRMQARLEARLRVIEGRLKEVRDELAARTPPPPRSRSAS